jgi:hypothetical protein
MKHSIKVPSYAPIRAKMILTESQFRSLTNNIIKEQQSNYCKKKTNSKQNEKK